MNKKTLVLGASLNPNRYSYKAIVRLRAHDIPVVAFGIKAGTIADVEISLTREKWEAIDTITLYLSPKNQVDFYDFIVALKPKRVLFNPGTENSELQKLLEKHGISCENACTLVLLSISAY